MRRTGSDYGPWLLLVAGMAVFLAGIRLSFLDSSRLGNGWEFTHFLKSLGVFLMFAGLIGWLAAATLLVVRLGRRGHM